VEAGPPRASWLRTLPGPETPAAHNLPARLTSFVGRDHDLAEVRRQLAEHRLVTLTGVGGVGKTRLALEVAALQLDRYLDGVRLVELAAVVNPRMVPHAVASVFDDIGEQSERSLEDLIVARLRSRELLLILDNCEHLLQACTELVTVLLRACPDVRIIATSREALAISGELIWPVAPLALPTGSLTANDAEQYGALRLFVERSQVRKPDFAVTDASLPSLLEICRRLDGIPLAIELAAAWIPTLTVQELAARLDGQYRLLTGGSRTALPRHQTLRALVDWSYDRLSEEEQVVLRELSVFAGGWTLEAAESVCTGAAQDSVLDVLRRLVAKSLVVATDQQGATRYGFLETIRQYAAQKLAGEGAGDDAAEAVQRRHAAYFVSLAGSLNEQTGTMLRGGGQSDWLERLTAEHDNLRAALRWCVARDEAEAALRLCNELARFWWIRGDLHEGLGWLEQALALRGPAPDTVRAAALNAAGALERLLGDYARAAEFQTEALMLWQRVDHRPGIASTFQSLGSNAKDRGAFAEAETYCEQALALYRELGDDWGVANVLTNLGVAMRRQGQYDRAEALTQETLAIVRARGHSEGIAITIGEIAQIARARGDHERAATLCAECLPVFQAQGLKLHLAVGLSVTAWVADARGQRARAARLFGAADALRQSIGAPVPLAEQSESNRVVARTRTALGAARFDAAFAEGQALTQDDAVQVALTGRIAPRVAESGPALSRREREVVLLLARGLSNREIADAMVVSQLTAATHVRNILRKLGLDRRTQVATWAAEHAADDAG
jgi:non-specific serine/threonine protein kinase